MSAARSPRTRLLAAERARLIEDAATRLFAEKGYVSTSVEDIVAAAGVTKPMLYRHFESKQGLCVWLLERYREELIAAPLREFAVDAADTPEARQRSSRRPDGQLERMVDAWLSWVEAHPDATRLLFTPIRGDQEVQQVQEELFLRQRDTQLALLREFVPGLAASDAVPLAEITRAGFAAVALWWLQNPDQPKSVVSQALVTMARGIVTAASDPDPH
jgi:AcrR family transcriptional regulator